MEINPRKEFGKYGIKNLKKFIQTTKKNWEHNKNLKKNQEQKSKKYQKKNNLKKNINKKIKHKKTNLLSKKSFLFPLF